MGHRRRRFSLRQRPRGRRKNATRMVRRQRHRVLRDACGHRQGRALFVVDCARRVARWRRGHRCGHPRSPVPHLGQGRAWRQAGAHHRVSDHQCAALVAAAAVGHLCGARLRHRHCGRITRDGCGERRRAPHSEDQRRTAARGVPA